MSHHRAPLWRVWHHDFCVLRSGSTKISLSLYFSRLSKPISLSFVSYIDILTILVALCRTHSSMSISFLHWGAEILDRALQKWVYSRNGLASAEERLWITPLDLLVTFLLRQPRMLWAFFAARAYSWLLSGLLPTLTTRSFCAELLPSQSYPSLYWCGG